MLVLGLVVFACGGSASETPPPLEPDLSRAAQGAPASGRYVVITPRARSQRAKEPEANVDDNGEAPATWGEGEPVE